MQKQLQMLLTEAITVLCKNRLQYRSHLNVEGLLGITLDHEDVLLFRINETVRGEAGVSAINIHLSKQASLKKQMGDISPMSRAKQKKRKQRKMSTYSMEKLTPTYIPLNNNNPERNSNEPYGMKPVPEGNFDDSASSQGELIIAKENLTAVERAYTENDHKQASVKKPMGDTSLMSRAKKGKQRKRRVSYAMETPTIKPVQEVERTHTENESSNAIIYASSNGQIDAPYTSPHQAWQNDSNDRSFAQQVRTNINFSGFIIKLFFRIGLATLLFQTNKGTQLRVIAQWDVITDNMLNATITDLV